MRQMAAATDYHLFWKGDLKWCWNEKLLPLSSSHQALILDCFRTQFCAEQKALLSKKYQQC